MEQYMPYIWLGAAVILAVLEGLTVQLVAVWFVIGALAASITTAFTDSIIAQSIVFVLVSAVCLAVTRPLIKKFGRREAERTNVYSLIGKTGTVIIEVNNSIAQGQINVGGQVWSAKCENDGLILKTGSKAVVKNISGVKLVLAPVNSERGVF